MSYTPSTDLLAVLRLTGGGLRTGRVPGLDYMLAAMSRAGMFALYVGAVAPLINQAATVWLKPATPSWSAEGTVFLWNAVTSEYEVATPLLWSTLLSTATSGATPIVQDVTTNAANVAPSATIVRVQNVGALVTLTMPLASSKVGGVLISDWANHAGANNILIQRTAPDVFPLGATSWTIAGDGGSVLLRPAIGGYVL